MDWENLEVTARYDGETWWAFVKKGDKVIAEPYISGKDPRSVIFVAEDMFGAVMAQVEDKENNYGLLFYRYGYDGESQQLAMRYYDEEYGVDVF